MKLALVGGERREAQPSLAGECPCCGSPLVAKCGERRTWHWAHRGERDCDTWWENETEWHLEWKGQFPTDWQEIVHSTEDGQRHIADVKTHDGWVIEFQRSHIPPEERRSREAFYPKLMWVVDATRLKRDASQFTRAWESGTPVNQLVRRVSLDGCRLLREWSESPAPVFFDFGKEQMLGLLFGSSAGRRAYIAPFSHAEFIETHRGAATKDFDGLVKLLRELVEASEKYFQMQTSTSHFRQYPRQHRRRRL